MIIGGIVALLLVVLIAFTINTIESIRKKRNSKISFKEAMDLVELPVVTFYNEDVKLNFLLDTGSNNSIINEAIMGNLQYDIDKSEISTIGMTGEEVKSSVCTIVLHYNGNMFEDQFTIIDMSSAFNNIKQESGVQIHGILGSKFFEKYKYILDFKELKAYIK